VTLLEYPHTPSKGGGGPQKPFSWLSEGVGAVFTTNTEAGEIACVLHLKIPNVPTLCIMVLVQVPALKRYPRSDCQGPRRAPLVVTSCWRYLLILVVAEVFGAPLFGCLLWSQAEFPQRSNRRVSSCPISSDTSSWERSKLRRFASSPVPCQAST
jgi:hypothetical protein